VDKNVLIIKLINLYCASFNDRYKRQTHLTAFLVFLIRSTAIIHQKWSGVASRCAWIMDYHVWGTMLEGYHKHYPKPNLITKLNEALQMNWDSLPQEPINRAVKSFTLWLKTCTKVDGEQFEHTMWLSNIRQSVYCVVSVTLFCCVSAQTFFSARKSLSSHAKISITLSYLKIIKCHLAVKCR